MDTLRVATLILFFVSTSSIVVTQEVLEVKTGWSAIVKNAPNGNGEQFPNRLPPGTRVTKLGKKARYYQIQLIDGRIGWSYTGAFKTVPGAPPSTPSTTPPLTPEYLLARLDVLKIIIMDVEVGDATIIICPLEDNQQDVILIDTGENDAQRIKDELIDRGIGLSGKPITRMIITHYDNDHFGDAPDLIPLSEILYDHGNNNIKD